MEIPQSDKTSRGNLRGIRRIAFLEIVSPVRAPFLQHVDCDNFLIKLLPIKLVIDGGILELNEVRVWSDAPAP